MEAMAVKWIIGNEYNLEIDGISVEASFIVKLYKNMPFEYQLYAYTQTPFYLFFN